MAKSQKFSVLAIAAHPDDIEFMMAGTLLLLRQAGAELHLWNLANGCFGTMEHSREEIIRLRWEEAQAAAKLAGAVIYPPIADDLHIFYRADLLAKVTAMVRRARPRIILTHSPQDYMEDHMNTARLVVSGAFARGMPNYLSDPEQPAWGGNTTIYHALPHGLEDGLRRRIAAELYIDIRATLERKREMLACHRTQKEWLDVSQGMDSYLRSMEEMSRAMGAMSGKFAVAEGWRRHSHLGFSESGDDPLFEVLQEYARVDPAYYDGRQV